jgi:uncharacterized coiled-coil DUF342 family protein
MNVNPNIDIDRFFENIITSYEDRIQKIQTAFQSTENFSESSHTLFDNVHNSLNDLKKERDNLNTRLCETLAKNGSLRKKDYNILMSGILNALDEKEKDAEHQFLTFLQVQKENALMLKNSLLNIKDITSQDALEKINLLKKQLTEISAQQEESKEKVMKTFVDFQNLHNQMTEHLEELLEKGENILIQDLKRVKNQINKAINPSDN